MSHRSDPCPVCGRTDWLHEPTHPREPSPGEVALILANPWTWMDLAMAASIWAPAAAQRLVNEAARRLRG